MPYNRMEVFKWQRPFIMYLVVMIEIIMHDLWMRNTYLDWNVLLAFLLIYVKRPNIFNKYSSKLLWKTSMKRNVDEICKIIFYTLVINFVRVKKASITEHCRCSQFFWRYCLGNYGFKYVVQTPALPVSLKRNVISRMVF